ncbi:MAG: DUF4912 domain-containing protein [Planctomycetaceae bacterium]|nr:DUF4912 domain-containing protein [Planctomycetaceae bacterium]
MARQRQLTGWRGMRKDELIAALLADDGTLGESDSTQNGIAAPRTKKEAIRPTKSATRDDHLRIVAVSPEWMRAEWMIAESSVRRVESALGQHRRAATPVLRLFEITDDECQTHGRTFVCDTEISLETDEWFVRVDEPGRMYRLQLGMRAHDGEFYGICCSNPVEMPASEPVNGLSNSTSRRDGIHVPSRCAVDDAESDVQLEIEVDVTIRGRSHPSAIVTIDNEHQTLKPNGTFERSFSLVDGRHVLPALSVSADGRREQTIVLALERNTKRLAPRDHSRD